MAGVITTGSLPKLNWPGLRSINGIAYREHPKMYSRVFKTVDSDKGWEEYQGVTGFPLGQVKPQGQSISYLSQVQGFNTRLVNQTMAAGFIVTMEERQDNLYQKVANGRTKALTFSMEQAKEVLGFGILNNAFTAGYTGGDGVILCSTAHNNVTGSTYSNAANPAADLSEASLEDGMIAVKGFTDDNGLYVDVRVKCLVIPRQLEFAATRIVKSPYQSGTANNDVNALKYTGSIPEIVTSVYLTSPGAWFLVTDTGNSGEGLIYQQRMAPEFAQDNDYDTKNFKAGIIERYVFGWDNARCVYGSNGP